MRKGTTSEEAINVYHKYISEVQCLNSSNCEAWKSKVSDSTKAYLGEHSDLYKRMLQLHFIKEETELTGNEFSHTVYKFIESERVVAKHLLNNCIDYIYDHGLQNSNKLNRKNGFEKYLFNYPVILGVAIFAMGIGYYMGTQKNDPEKMKLKQQLEESIELSKELKESNNSLLKSLS